MTTRNVAERSKANNNWRNLVLLAAGAIGGAALLVHQAHAQATADIWAAGVAKGEAAKKGLVSWVQIGGVISMLVCGGIFIATGRANFRWLFGSAGGLFIAGLADSIVNFFVK